MVKMEVIYYCTVIMVCITLGNSLGSTRNHSLGQERFNFFDAELLQVFNEKEKGNMLISPIGIKLVLGMLMEGAEGSTAEEIRAALRLPHEPDARRKEFNTWLSILQVNGSSNILKMANQVFLSDRCTATSDFGSTLRKYYSAGITSVKFEDPKEASRTINDWVSNQTLQLIPSMVDEGQMDTNPELMVTSAVYFKGLWSQPFASERSTIRCFYSDENKCEDSLTMAETGNFDYGYISRLNAKAVMLPYKGGEFSMLLLLPSKKESVENLGRDLVHVSLNSILSEMKEHEVFVQIPQFEINFKEDLVESLKKLHISRVFSQNANLSKMLENHFGLASVSRIYHSAKITVNEEGSEAAAVTGALFVPLMGGTTTSFVANRPFLFFVISPAKNLVLFAGKIVSSSTSQYSDKSSPSSISNKVLPLRTHGYSQEKRLILPSSCGSGPLQNCPEESAKATESPEKLFYEAKHTQRGQLPMGPKFRSIRPLFSIPQAPSSLTKERRNNADYGRKFTGSFLHPPLHNSLGPQPFQKEMKNYKKEKTALEHPRTQKPREPPLDDWRRHVLFFT